MTSYEGFADIYDVLMGDVKYKEWVEYYIQVFSNQQFYPRKIVDLACGTGNLSIPLAQKGYDVTGIDRSEEMLRAASEKARREGIPIHYICQDIRNVVLHKSVDCMICGCDGINYLSTLEDVEKCFASVYSFLKEKGLFIFDISSRFKLKNTIGNNLFYEDGDDITYLWQNEYDEQQNISTMDLSFFVKQDELYRRFKECHIQRAHDISELRIILERIGFSVEGVYDCFSFNPPSRESERIQFVCKK